jgi:hypothetical protein
MIPAKELETLAPHGLDAFRDRNEPRVSRSGGLGSVARRGLVDAKA